MIKVSGREQKEKLGASGHVEEVTDSLAEYAGKELEDGVNNGSCRITLLDCHDLAESSSRLCTWPTPHLCSLILLA